VDELAEVLAVDFSATGGIPKVDENMRWEDQEQAVLSACSSLISVIEYRGSCLVQFSHFSVREFLMSDRLAASNEEALRYHHIHPRPAHTIMAQACLAVILHLDKKMDLKTIENYPLAKYAGYHLSAHAEFEDVLSHITDGMDVLLDSEKPHFDMWVWLQIGDWEREMWHNFCLTGEGILESARWYRIPQYPPQVSPLYYVAALGQLSLAKHLISKRPQDLHTKDGEGCTPLHIAVLAGNVEVSQLLLRHPIDSHFRYIKGYNLLHMAAWKGHLEITRMLLEHDESMKLLINSPNNYGQTPLHLASTHDHSSIVSLLLKFGADMETQDRDKMTALQCASGFIGSGKAAQLLLEHGAHFGVRNEDGQMPLHLASMHNHPNVVALLLKLGADVDLQDNESRTPLFFASSTVAQLLLKHGASVHVRDKIGRTPLHLASASARFEPSDPVALLLKFGADVDALDSDNMTPLLCALESFGSGGVVQLLLEHGASVHVRNKRGRTPLHFASASHFVNADVVALLLKLGADVDARDSADMTPLLCALDSFPSDEVVRLLLEHGASVHVRNKGGQTPLHFASASEQTPPDVVASLLKLGADVDSRDSDDMTPLLCAFESFGSGEVAQLLMEHGASVHVRNKKGQTPLHLASGWCHSDVLASLLKLGADVDSRDSDDMTPLLHALVHRNNSSAVKLLLEHGASVHVRNKNGQMPLHLASQSRRSDVVASLLMLGADVDAQDNNHMTPLHFALSSRSPYRFIEFDVEGNGRVMEAKPEVEMDEEALRAIELLLGHGANVHLQNDRGKTPLQIAPVKMKHDLEQSFFRYSQND